MVGVEVPVDNLVVLRVLEFEALEVEVDLVLEDDRVATDDEAFDVKDAVVVGFTNLL